MTDTPAIFLSHAHADNAICDELVTWLKQRVTGEIFYDRERLHAGDEWSMRIQSALRNHQVFVVILSRNALQSPWVRTETNFAISKAISDRDKERRVIPVLVDPALTPVDIENFLPLLAAYQFIAVQVPGQNASWETLAQAIQGTPLTAATAATIAAQPEPAPERIQEVQDAVRMSEEAHAAFEHGNWHDVVLFAGRALSAAANSRDDRLNAELAQAQAATGNVQQATATIKQALALNAYRGDYWLLLAKWLTQLPGSDGAAVQEAWDNAYVNSGSQETRATILKDQAQAFIKAQQWEQALTACARGQTLAPQDPVWSTLQKQAHDGQRHSNSPIRWIRYPRILLRLAYIHVLVFIGFLPLILTNSGAFGTICTDDPDYCPGGIYASPYYTRGPRSSDVTRASIIGIPFWVIAGIIFLSALIYAVRTLGKQHRSGWIVGVLAPVCFFFYPVLGLWAFGLFGPNTPAQVKSTTTSKKS